MPPLTPPRPARRRRPLRAALSIAALLAAPALYLALREPAMPPEATPDPAALRLNLPLLLQPGASAPVTPAPPLVAASAARPAPARPPLPRLAAPTGVGSEGYGPLIDRALAGEPAAPAWDAVMLLRQCASNALRRHSFETARDQGAPAQIMTQLMVEADAEARRCQTVTPRQQALLPELVLRALRQGSAPAAAALSGMGLREELAPAQRLALAEGLRREARSGHAATLAALAQAHEAWGLSDLERLGFIQAWLAQPAAADAELRATLEGLAAALRTRLTPAQQLAARAAGEQLAARAAAGRTP